MRTQSRWTRRGLLKMAAFGTVAAGVGSRLAGAGEVLAAERQRIPLKIGIRAASMKMAGDLDVIKTAARIPGIRGVELQTTSGTMNLLNPEVVRRYKEEADRWGIRIPSLAGVWRRGVKIHSPAAGQCLLDAIRAAEMLGAGVILVAFFRQDAPDMTRDESYGPIVAMLQKTAPRAADAGVALGLENSLSPADNRKLVDLVDHSAVGVYYDLYNMAHYGHADQAVPGVRLLGKKRIRMVHVKNGPNLLEEPGPIDWPAAFRALSEIQYDGWFVYETQHDSMTDCIEDTKKNNAFLQQHVKMPLA